MAVEIDSELLDFKSKVSGKTGAMKTSITTLGEMLGTIVTANSNAKEEISSVYKTPNSATALSSFDSLNTSIESAKTAINDKVTAVIAKAEDLISKIEKLESLKKEIEAAEKAISDAQARMASLVEEKDAGEIESLQKTIDENTTTVKEKTTEFNTSHATAKTVFANLKATDGTAPTIA